MKHEVKGGQAVGMPTSVREALGDKVALDLLSWFIRVIPSVAVTREEFKEVIVRLDNLERELKGLRAEMDRRFEEVNKRFEEINMRFEGVNQRFEDWGMFVNKRFEEMNLRMDNRLETVHARIDSRGTRMLVQSRWLIGSIAVLGTVISILLAIGQFLR